MNERVLTQSESRKIMLEILKDVTAFCDKYSITYYLSFGTLIGAIRHRGFIPWDDDIDIEMPRPDYEIFVKLYRDEGKFKLITPTQKDSFYFYSKVYDESTIKYEEGIDYNEFSPIGIDIDIFTIDGQPDDCELELFKKITDKNIKLHKWFQIAVRPYYGKLRHDIVTFICRLIGKDFFRRQYLKNAQKYPFETSSYVGPAGIYSGYKGRHRKEVYANKIKVEFEGEKFWAPSGYDEYLRDLYGDYMKLPPIEEQHTHHLNKVFWKD